MYDISSCLRSSPKASKMLDVSGLDAVLIFNPPRAGIWNAAKAGSGHPCSLSARL
jgi:hypothetical protein